MVATPRSFNFADVWEMAADAVPQREALVVASQRRTYAELEERANRLAHHLSAQGVGPGDHVALYLENCAEYLEAMLAAFKLRAVPINVNHRYVAGELRQLLSDSDSVGVITQPSLRPVVDDVVVAGLRFVLTTGEAYEAALAAAPGDRPMVDGRSGDDRYVIYTGGTTGPPKGVVWRQEDAFFACIGGGDPMRLEGPVERPGELPDRIADHPLCYLPVAPMMHAAAQWTSLSWLFSGGKVVLMPGSLDPPAVWRAVEAERVNVLTVVGDAVARPLLDTRDAAGAGAYDVSSLFSVSNGGAPMTPTTRRRVAAALPNVVLVDGFGSSEAGTQGSSRVPASDLLRPSGAAVTQGSSDAKGSGAFATDLAATPTGPGAEDAPGDDGDAGKAGSAGGTAAGLVSFERPAKPTIVVNAAGDEVAPGSGAVGQVLAGGRLPLGYHNDPQRTAEVFVERDGQRWLVTGDMATVAADGSIVLLGRGSGVVNTGGEKVFPEEVEGVLKAHPAVYDCLVVGVPDERWGQAVAAVVQPAPGEAVDLATLVTHCKAHLAGYKAPRHLVVVDQIVRSPSGKADYRWARRAADAALMSPS